MLFECLTGALRSRRRRTWRWSWPTSRGRPPPVTELRADCPPALADGRRARCSRRPPTTASRPATSSIDALRAVDPEPARARRRPASSTDPDATGGAGRREPPRPADGPPAGGAAAAAPPAPRVAGRGGPRRSRRLAALVVIAARRRRPAMTATARSLASAGVRRRPASRRRPRRAPRGRPRRWRAHRATRRSPASRPPRRSHERPDLDHRRAHRRARRPRRDHASVEAYDPAIDTWTAGPDLPLPLHHAMAVDLQRRARRHRRLGAGGRRPDRARPPTRSTRCATASGSSCRASIHARAAGAAAVVDDKIVVVGGQADGELVAPTEVFDGKTLDGRGRRSRPRASTWPPRPTATLPLRGRRARRSRPIRTAAPSSATTRRPTSGRSCRRCRRRAAASAPRWSQRPPGGGRRRGPDHAIARRRPVLRHRNREVVQLPPHAHPAPRAGAWSGSANTLYVIDGAKAPTHAESTSVGEALDFKR